MSGQSFDRGPARKAERRLTGQLDVAVVDQDQVALLGQLRPVELLDHETVRREADELGAVEAIRVVQRTGAVDDWQGEGGRVTSAPILVSTSCRQQKKTNS